MLSKRSDSDENGSSKPGSFFTILKSTEECSMVGYKMNRKEGSGKLRLQGKSFRFCSRFLFAEA